MSGVTLGFLKYVLGLDTISFRKGISQADADLAKMQRSFAAHGKKLQTLGKQMTAFATLPLVGSFTAFAEKGIHEAQRMVNAMAQVDSALKSTGGVAGVTGEQLKKAAESFEAKSLFESEDILRDVSARLLAFGSVHGAMFQRAQQDILDYAQRSGKDLGAATTLIGKSLENPAKAAGALFKAGVSLTDGQKALIKQFSETGNAAGAQEIILTALETKYRGAASAAADVDPYHKMHVAFKQLAETIGTALLPLIAPVTNAIASMVGAFTSLSPATQKWTLIILGLGTVLGPTLIAFGNILIIVGKIGPAVSLAVRAWELLRIGLLAARVASLAALPALIPFLIPLAAIAAAVGVAYLAWKNWDKIVPIVRSMVAGVTAWLSKLATPFNWVRDKAKAVGDAFLSLYDRVVGHSYIPDMVNEIGEHIARLDALMVQPTAKMTKAAAASFKALQDSAQPLKDLLGRLFPEAVENNQYLADLKVLNAALKDGTLKADEYAEALKRLNTAHYANVPKIDVPAFGSVPSLTVGDGPNDIPAFSDYLAGIPSLADRASSAVADFGKTVVDALKNGALDAVHMLSDGLMGVAQHAESLGHLLRRIFVTEALNIGQSLLGDALKSLSGLSGARALGGPVVAGGAYLVGERGPEIFTPSSSGRIISNDNSRRMVERGGHGGRGDTYMTVITPDANSFRRSERQILQAQRRALR